jgi:hypothetical protein
LKIYQIASVTSNRNPRKHSPILPEGCQKEKLESAWSADQPITSKIFCIHFAAFAMAALKRPLDDPSAARKSKKSKTSNTTDVRSESAPQATSKLASEEVDFPRGGGTSFTPLEVKAIRAEAVKEANAELFEVRNFFHFLIHS